MDHMTITQQYIPLIQKVQNENWAKYPVFQMQKPSYLSESGIQMLSLFSVSNLVLAKTTEDNFIFQGKHKQNAK